MQQVLENQNAFSLLDSKPLTIAAQDHRPAYGTDGDYFSKPSVDDMVEQIYAIFNEIDPEKFIAL